MSKEDKLESIRNRATQYEVVAVGTDGRNALAGYAKHGKMNLLKMLRLHGTAWAVRIAESDQITFSPNGKAVVLGNFKITFSGRTQREAIISGELPWFHAVYPIL